MVTLASCDSAAQGSVVTPGGSVAHDLHAALLTDLNGFLGHETYDDDMTMMVMKWHGFDVLPVARTEAVEETGARPRTRRVEAEYQTE